MNFQAMLERKFLRFLCSFLAAWYLAISTEAGIPDGAGTLTFVFDTTGSMYDDLVQVRAGASRILAATLKRKIKPLYNYALVPFHDPEVGPVVVTTSPERFKQQLDDLFVNPGGDDCPETSLSAIILALEISLPGSHIYVFTDAEAKDYHLVPQVLRLIQEKQSQVIFVLTGDCGNVSSPGLDAYEQIAFSSSGIVFNIRKRDVGEMLKSVEKSLQANKVNILSTNLPDAASTEYSVVVDPNLRQLMVAVSGKNCRIELRDPDGSLVTPDRGLQELLTLKSARIVAITNPRPGPWNITVSSNGTHTLRITGLSSVKFITEFGLHPIRDGSEANFRPFAGFQNFGVVQLKGIASPGTAQTIQLLDILGKSIEEIPFTPRKHDPLSFDWKDFNPPQDLFYIRVIGIDQNNNEFYRTSTTAVSAILPEPPKVTAFSPQEVLYGSPAVLTCEVNSSTPFRVQWFRDNVTLGPALTRAGLVNVTHVIPTVTREDQGTYSCFVGNAGGGLSGIVELITKVPRAVIIEQPFSTVTVVAGNTIQLTCSTYGVTPVRITWRKDGQEVTGFRHIKQQRNSNLFVHVRTREDAGQFECIATNEAGDVVRKINLVVHERPVVRAESSSKNFQRGDNVRLKCEAQGLPVPLLVWKKDGVEVQESVNIVIEKTGSLLIKRAAKHDAGSYECEATNQAGHSSDSVKLMYTVPPSVSAENEKVLTGAGASVTLKCTANGEPRSSITWYDEHRQEIHASRRIAVSGLGHLIISAVEFSDSGFYTCLASNVAGSDSVTIELTVVSWKNLYYELGSERLKSIASPGTAQTIQLLDILGKSIEEIPFTPRKHDPLSFDWKDFNPPQDLFYIRVIGIDQNNNEFYRTSTTAVSAILPEPPKVTAFSPQEVLYGSPAVLTCEVNSSTPFRVQWFRDNVTLGPALTRAGLVNVTHVIPTVTREDQGTYSCFVGNAGGGLSGIVELITKGWKNLYYELGSERLKGIASRGTAQTIQLLDILGKSIEEIPFTPRKQDPLSFDWKDFNPPQDLFYIRVIGIDQNNNEFYRTSTNAVSAILPEPPKVTAFSPQEVLYGSPAVLTCEVNSSTPFRVQWFRDNVTLGPALTRAGLVNVTHVIPTVTREDQGTYSCFVGNAGGGLSGIVELITKVPRAVIIEQPFSTVTVVAGNTIQLTCSTYGVTPVRITWRKDGQEVTGFHHIKQQRNSNLFVHVRTREDAGQFECIATNEAGDVVRKINLVVHERPVVRAESSSKNFQRGDNVRLKCEAQGLPVPLLVWKKDGVEVQESVNIVIEKTGSLLIKRAAKHDAGSYECEATNQAGNSSDSVKLMYTVPPSVSAENEKVLTRAGASVTLKCTANGEPRSSITWYDEHRQEIHASRRIAVSGLGHLNISAVEFSDSGFYTCLASNVAGSDSVTIELTVVIPPRVTVDSQEVSVMMGETAILKCTAGGEPRPTIKWYKEEINFLKFGRTPISASELLVIKDASAKDAGTYRCIATNEAGQDSATVRVSTGGGAPRIVVSPSDQTASLGANVTFTCRARGSPKPVIRWNNALGIAADTDARVSLLPSGDMHIWGVRVKNAGVYTCIAENEYGTADAQAALVLPGIAPPAISKPHNDTIFAIVSDTVVIPCEVSGSPTPHTAWTKNDRAVSSFNRKKFTQQASGALRIRDVLVADSGLYTCIARNTAGTDELHIGLFVYAPPKFIRVPSNLTLLAGDELVLICGARGYPVPVVRWHLNGRLLPYNESQLTVQEVQSKHAGAYKCTAENAVGQVTAVAVVIVLSEPTITKAQPNGIAIAGKSVTLKCQAEGFPRPSIEWYKGDKLIQPDGVKYVQLPAGSLQVTTLEPPDNDVYQCTAFNRLGSVTRKMAVFVQVSPKFVTLPQDVSIVEGESFTLECEARGLPFPQITWFLNDTRLQLKGSIVDVVISTKESDEGVYRCLAESSAGSANATAFVSISPASEDNKAQIKIPEFVLKPVDTLIDVGDSLLWNCTVKSQSRLNMTWIKDGSELRTGVPAHVQIAANNSLKITSVRPEDEGLYQCVATSGSARHVVQAMLTVRIHGGWGDYQEWLPCSSSCGTGRQYRRRFCDNPSPANNGRHCPGSEIQSRLCNHTPCPQDGGWSVWTEWQDCSRTCNEGVVVRTRHCNNPPPRYNGRNCSGEWRESRPCNQAVCPTQGVQAAVGRVHGTVNGVMLPDFRLLATITKAQDNNTRVESQFTGLPEPIRNWLQAAIPLTSPIHWAVAYERSGTANGLAMTNGTFIYKTEMKFDSGETLYLEHKAEGVNDEGVLIMQVDVKGKTPMFRANSTVKHAGASEEFVHTGEGEVRSVSRRVMDVNGAAVSYLSNSTVTFSPLLDEIASLTQSVKTTAVGIQNPDGLGSGTLSFDVMTVMERAPAPRNCPEGMKKEQGGKFCEDIDECRIPDTCSHSCHNEFKTFFCACREGYTLESDGKTCTDIEECALEVDSCAENLECINTNGSFVCLEECSGGYIRTRDNTCRDIDECSLNDSGFSSDDPCAHNCENLPGSYQCSCHAGFDLRDGRCEDSDECAKNVCEHRCTNTDGGYKCSCFQGFKVTGDNCEDIDECAINKTICGDSACVNIPGSYQCLEQCSVGFKRTTDDKKCIDVNECADGSHSCRLNQMCMNTLGSFYCLCPRGYSAITADAPCQDVNECTEFPGICQYACVNSRGSFRCICPAGSRLNPDERTCLGVDGCMLKNLTCAQRCSFSEAGYACSCARGFRLNSNKQDCDDLDECASNETNTCQYQCLNTAGGYRCTCPDGYRISDDGKRCEDLNECALTGGLCGGSSCFNTRGSYRCLPSGCPQQYRQVSGGYCVNSCPSPGFCSLEAVRRDTVTVPLGIPANRDLLRLVPFFPPYIMSRPYRCSFQYSFSVSPSPFGMKQAGDEAIIYTTQDLNTPGAHQLQVTANLRYLNGRLACRTVFTVYIDIAKFNF